MGAGGNDKLAQSFLANAQNAKFMGQGIDKLSARMRLQFGDAANARLLSLGVQFSKLGENISRIFRLDASSLEPLLRGIQAVLSFFNKNEDAAKDLHATVTKFTEAAIGGLLDLTIVLLKSYLWLRQHESAWNAVKMTVALFAVGIGALGIVAAAALGLIAAGLALVVAAMGALVAAGYGIGEVFADIAAWWKALDLSDIGLHMVNGIVNGIKAAGPAILDALKGAAMSAVYGVRDALLMHSPSRLTFGDGGNIVMGYAGGVDQKAPMLEDSMESAVGGGVASARAEVGASTSVAPAMSAPRAGGDGGGRVLNFTNCFNGGSLSEESIRKAIHTALDEDALDAGLAGAA